MHKFLQNKRLVSTTSVIVVLIIIVGVFGFRTSASAGIFSWVGDATARAFGMVLGGFIALLVQLIGGLVVNLMYLLLAIAQYNQFLASTAVTTGWVVVRDVVNMFFVVVLLAIALGTILQQQQYSYSQTLPKFLAAAILVNFSKTICGLFIDFAQIVMMTFVGAFSQAGGGNFAVLIGLNRLLSMVLFSGSGEAKQVQAESALMGMVLALIFVSLALIVIAIMVAILVIRIIALWFLIILSPAAFFLMSLPQDRGYASKWWDQFINYLLVGPVMAFFLWLSFTIVAVAGNGINDSNDIYIATELGVHFEDRKFLAGELADVGQSGISTIGGMAGYILGIGLLIGSLMAAQQLSSVGGSMAGGAISGFKDYMQGKRGPFNPLRTGREVLGGLGSRWEKRRKERVERLTDRVQSAIGVVASAPRKGAQQLIRGAMQTEAGQAVARGYRQVEHGLDNVIRTSTGALTGGHFELGFGRDFRTRIEEQKRNNSLEADTNRQAAGTLRADVVQRQNTVQADERERDEHIRLAQEARGQGNIPLATTHENEATRLQTRIDQNNQIIEQHNASADHHDNLVQAAEFRGLLATLRRGFAGFFGASVRTAALGWAGSGVAGLGGAAAGALPGGLMAAAVVGPSQLSRLGRWGEVQKVDANEAQANAVDAIAKKHAGKSNEEKWEMYTGVIPGHADTDEERMGLLKSLIEEDGLRDRPADEIRRMVQGHNAMSGTVESFDRLIKTKRPQDALRPMTHDQRIEAFRSGKWKPEDIKMADITVPGNPNDNAQAQALIGALADPTVDRLGEYLKKVTADVRTRMMRALTDEQWQQLFKTGQVTAKDIKIADITGANAAPNFSPANLMHPDVNKMGPFLKDADADVRRETLSRLNNAQWQELLRTEELAPAQIRETDVNNDFIDNLADPTVDKLGDYTRKVSANVRNRMLDVYRTRLEAQLAAGTAVTRNASGGVDFNAVFARDLRQFSGAAGDGAVNALFAMDNNGRAIPGAFNPATHGLAIEGILTDSANSSVLAGMTRETLTNRTSQVQLRVPRLNLGAFSRLVRGGAENYINKGRASSNITAFTQEVLDRARAGTFGTASTDIQDVAQRSLGS